MKQFNTTTVEGVLEVLSYVKSAPSGIRMSSDRDYRFEVDEVKNEDPEKNGFLIRCGFWRPDTNTGAMGEGFGRWNFVPRGSSVTAIVMTAWVAIELVVKHEAMEAFEFMGVKVLNPHKTLDELAFPVMLQVDKPKKSIKDVIRSLTLGLLGSSSLLEHWTRATTSELEGYKKAADEGKAVLKSFE